MDSADVGCGGLLVQAEISQQNAYLYNGTQVGRASLWKPVGGSCIQAGGVHEGKGGQQR